MSAPLINAEVINAPLDAGALVSQPVEPTPPAEPAQPVTAALPGALINAGLIGGFAINAASILAQAPSEPSEPSEPVALGPSALVNEGMLNACLIGAGGTMGSGTPQPQPQSFTVHGLAPVAFGTAEVVTAPPSAALTASGLRAASFGQPSLVIQTGEVPGIASARLGVARLHVQMPAQGGQPVRLGTPSSSVALRAQGLRASGLGVATLVQNSGAGSIAPVRFGPVRAVVGGLQMQVSGLKAASLGAPSLGGISMRARTLCPVRLGRPTLQRENTC